MSRLGNGVGSVYKKQGKRKKPCVARKTLGFKMNGQPIYRYIGYYKTKAEAMTALMDYNKDPYSLEGERICDMYEGFYAAYSEKHSEKVLSCIRSNWKHLDPIKDESIANISRKQLQMFFDELNVTGVVKKKVKDLLKQIMDYSIRYDVIQPERIAILNYIDLSSRVPTRKIDRERFTKEEIDRLWKMNDDMSHLLLFLIYTGLRAGEYCDLNDESIDQDMIMHIGKAKTEAGIRMVPLSDKAQKLAPLPFFKDYQTLYRKYTKWCGKSGFDHHLHDTRHTCASLLADVGTDKRVIQAILGHKGDDVTDRVYTHIGIDVMRDALNQI